MKTYRCGHVLIKFTETGRWPTGSSLPTPRVDDKWLTGQTQNREKQSRGRIWAKNCDPSFSAEESPGGRHGNGMGTKRFPHTAHNEQVQVQSPQVCEEGKHFGEYMSKHLVPLQDAMLRAGKARTSFFSNIDFESHRLVWGKGKNKD